ncbi:MAG: TetR/AcrR family transcriptional regulator, partial [Pseudomonadota bacterium]
MPKKRRPHDELKPAVLAAARSSVVEGGISAVSARGIAEDVGVSVGTLYNLFGHLDGIIRAMNVVRIAELQVALVAALDAADDEPEARLLAMAEAYFDFALSEPNLWEALFRYSTVTPSGGEIEAAEATLFSLLRRAAGDEAEGGAADESLRTLWAAVHGVVELAMSRRTVGADMDTARYHARLVVMAGLRGY